MSTQDALDLAIDAFDAGRPLDEAAHRLVARAAKAFSDLPSYQRTTVLRQEGLRARDRLIVKLAEDHCGELKGLKTKADQIATWARRYEGTAWKRDRHAPTRPDHIAGRPEELIWRALKAHKRFPSNSRLREILTRAGL